MGELWKQTSEIATDIQTLSHELHSSKLEYLGIEAAMRGFCREFEEQQQVERSISRLAIPAQALIAKRQKRAEGAASSAWRSG